MMNPESITIHYDDPAQPMRILRKMRRFGLGAPTDHVIVELLRVVMLLIPLFLLFAGLITPRELLAVMAGYFGLRWFDRFLKPRMLAATGPSAFKHRQTKAIKIRLDPKGLTSESDYGILKLGWADVPPPRVFQTGVLIRVDQEQSLPIDANLLPDGITPAGLAAQIQIWQAGANA